jgi:uncharacterized protein
MESIFQPVADKVRAFLEAEACGHDYFHAERVFKNSLYIHAQENAGDRYIIGVAALAHDLCRPWEKQTGKSHFGEEALEIINATLSSVGVLDTHLPAIIEVIRYHDVYDWDNPQPKSIELQIVQDADNLDAIGALGIARTFAFGGANGLQMYEPGENLDFAAAYIDNPNHRTTTIAHFYEKLLKLQDHMNTTTGKRLGHLRHERMEHFLTDFFAEWNGDFN